MSDTPCIDEVITAAAGEETPVVRNLNQLWLSCVLDELEAVGVRRVVLCPGARSAAMALAVRERPSFVDVVVSADERSGAYTALGMIKATGEPAMVVTTSGSAVANLVPALTEADECGLPLVLVTCDRPRSLRGSGFGQMIDHVGACAAFVRAAVDLPDPLDSADAFTALRTRVAAVLAERDGPRPGPVQINLPFAGRYDSTEPCAISPTALREARRPAFFHPPIARRPNDIDALVGELHLRPGLRGLIIAGPECGIAPDVLARFAKRTGFPVLADAASGLRAGGNDAVLSGYDALQVKRLRPVASPELIVRFGFAPVMPLVQDYLLEHPCPTLRVSRTPLARDYLHETFTPLVAPSADELDALATVLAPGDEQWLAAWRGAARTVSRQRRAVLDMLPWGELPAAHEIFAHEGFDFIHFGNSMPIRHADLFYENRGELKPTFSNRGVWGIDGTLGTFLGEAVATRQRGMLVLGDLAFLHDLPALANLQRHPRAACICVVNNAGGAIFDFLPLASQPDYETAIRNPYQCDVGLVAAAFGLRYARAVNRQTLRAALDGAAACEGVTIVEAVVAPGSAYDGLHCLGAMLECL
ncbi:2-succinyl-5-enolpyruvyl-6-hydroxy-3-cyclohexene-1-carboxylic-acid synthase [Trinickia fusca]|uniref:2-succinyl-5-enolpyruvyl-6-hydroxy-3-cyclohexene-1-carboxylate synthase n=1 Tax=Trinickia fusca TaxID=2419777 RepID=A0A494X2N7_9BURK|nr:2-succinyl-5-enolpyruvyl-6-hydroxy-3-cyclohexene-1-carboxylic-acid synthase [Trinickia fusca]RKP44600.1 2-succinyl-5-enolpyruvyl-6-hydroxy-3-cyclohexene-1-carboxylic-acid synthase [Trinickia fusca]